MKRRIGLFSLLFGILAYAVLCSSTVQAQNAPPANTPTPVAMQTPESTQSPTRSPVEFRLGELIAQFGPLAIAAIFAALLGFFGLQRLQNLDTEIRTTRKDRDQLRKELRSDLQDNLDRSLRIQEERLEILESKITAEITSQRQQFNAIIEAQQKTTNEQLTRIENTSSEFTKHAQILIEEIEERRHDFTQETAWLRESSIGLRRPRNVKDAFDLATAAATDGRRTEAIQVLQLVIDQEVQLHGTSNDYFNAAVRAASVGDLVLAREINAEGLKHYPDDIDLLTDYADNCGKTGEIQEAIRVWDKLSNNPKAKSNWRYWIFYSDFLENQGEFERSFELLEDAKNHLPNPTMAYREQAEAMENRGEYEEAVRLYEEALKFNPSEDIARLKLSQLLYKLGKLDDALEHIEWAIRYVLPRNMRYFTAHYYKGQILLAMNRREDARKAFRVASIHDEDAEILLRTLDVEEGPNQ
jgi:tetratricopeptide (TPR) repeat protein